MTADAPTPANVAEAREAVEQALRDGALEGAIAALDRLAQLAPDAPHLAVLRQEVQTARDRAVREAVASAERLLAQDRPRRALEVLARVQALAPERPDVRRVEQDAQRAVEGQQGRGRARPLLVEARKLVAQGQIEQALRIAEEAVSLAPEDARSLRLRDELAEQVEKARQAAAGAASASAAAQPRPEPPRHRARALVASAQARLGRDEVDAAAADAEEALRLDPGVLDAEAVLERIRVRRRELERRRRVDTLVRDAARLLEAGRFQACLALVAQLVTLEPAHPAAQDLRTRAEARLREAEAQRTTVQGVLAEGRAALAARDWPRAVERLEAVLVRDTTHAEARRALAEARARLAEQERVAAMLESAQARFQRDEIEAAERDVQAVLRLAPENADALALSERLWARRRELRRERPQAPPAQGSAPSVAETRVEPSRLETARVEPRALDAEPARPAAAAAPDPATLPAAPSTDEQVAVAVREANRLIREGRPDRALDALATARALAPDHPQLAQLTAQAERATQTRDVRGRVRALVDQARKASVEGDLQGALAAAEEAVALAPDDARALRLRDELEDRLDRARRGADQR